MNKEEAIRLILNSVVITSKAYTKEDLIRALSKKHYVLKEELNCTHTTVTRLMDKLAPDRIKGEKLCKYLLRSRKLKVCCSCDEVKTLTDFYGNNSKSDRIANSCISCQKDYLKDYYPDYYVNNKDKYAEAKVRYKLQVQNATPKWANREKIRDIYLKCPKGYHVDHVIPLQGDNVCGLHVETNLQYLTAFENISKGNKFSS